MADFQDTRGSFYIPHGCDQQGRLKPGRHVPRCEWMRNRWVGLLAALFGPVALVALIAAVSAFWPAN